MNYKRVHDNIIKRAREQKRSKDQGIYYEAHHIIPRCIGGTGSCLDWSWHKNIVLLTAKEHYIIHRLLTRIYPENKKINQAYAIMTWGRTKSNKRYLPGSRSYQEAKEGIKGTRFQQLETLRQALISANQITVDWNKIYKRFGMPELFHNKKPIAKPDSLKESMRLAGVKEIDWKTIGLLPGVINRYLINKDKST